MSGSKRRSRPVLVSAGILAVVLAVVLWQSWQVYRQQQREAAAWRRVGKCTPITNTNTVQCTGVRLIDMTLPSDLAVCADQPVCTAKVNREALPHFKAALDEVVRLGLGDKVVQFQTVSRRRCKDATSGGFIPDCVSKHSYGIAVDFRPFADNARWDQVIDSDPLVGDVVKVFQRHGFRWGGDFTSNFDPQHLEWIPK